MLSRIFEWFGQDFADAATFESTGTSPAAVLRFIAPYLPEDARAPVRSFDPAAVGYLDYDWTLNDVDSGR